MSQRSSILHNIFKYSFSPVTSFFLFLLLIISGRVLGAEDFGRFSFALAFALLLEPLLDPGIYHLLIREVARNRDQAQKYVSHMLTWKLLVAPVYFLLIYVIANIIRDDQQALFAVYLIAVSTFIKSSKDVLRSAVLAHEHFGLDTISLCIERLSLLIFGAIALYSGKGLIGLCMVFVFVRMLDFTVLGFMARNVCRIHFDYDFAFIKRVILTAVPIGAYYITLNIYHYVDTVMISVIRTDTEVGLYNAGYRIYEGLIIIPALVSTVFMPRLAEFFKSSIDDFQKLAFKGIKFTFLLSLIVAVNGIFLSEKVIIYFLGNDYINSVIALNILLSGILFVFIINFLQTLLITMDKQTVILRLAIAGLLLNIVLNIYLITKLGYVGAAVATIAVECLIFICLLYYIHEKVRKIKWWNLFGKPLASILIATTLTIWSLSGNALSLKILVLNITFFAILYSLKFFDKDEFYAFGRLLPGKR